jgi:hypothetical protein
MRWLMRNVWRFEEQWVTAEQIGRMAAIHASHYPCGLCGNPRRYEDAKSPGATILTPW